MTRYVITGVEPDDDQIPWNVASEISDILEEHGGEKFEGVRCGIDVRKQSRRRR